MKKIKTAIEYLKKEAYLRPIPYIPELIVDLCKNDFLLVLASSSPHEQINYILENLRIRHYFHATISGEDVKKGKPHHDEHPNFSYCIFQIHILYQHFHLLHIRIMFHNNHHKNLILKPDLTNVTEQ